MGEGETTWAAALGVLAEIQRLRQAPPLRRDEARLHAAVAALGVALMAAEGACPRWGRVVVMAVRVAFLAGRVVGR